MFSENRNTILAIVLSLVVLLGWQYFIAKPQLERQQAELQAQQEKAAPAGATQDANTPAPAGTTPGQANAPTSGAAGQTVAMTREEALAKSERIDIDTPRVSGSINLTGGRIDDLRLKDYHETVDKSSPTIVLLSPKGAPKAYYADYGWVADPGADLVLPGNDTQWTKPEGAELTPATPVTLTYDNGAGLVFKRTFSIDENYMFTIDQSVENNTGTEVKLYPYGLIVRNGKPDTAGFYILHEGMLGVFGDEGLKEVKYKDLEEDHQVRPPQVDQGWLGFTDKYWAATLIPMPKSTFQPNFTYTQATDNFQVRTFSAPA